ncbi:MAG: RNA 2',3'-cyclic phosphodiesterase [Candidatus Pacebacteria bacterium]|nr:RNA 2',3'-cyclic phosphodiesterase [Candidatus Paceibacterota bacterium]NUQ57364.1 RNA 2',3'-cyclic phosphodiesterase [Candidatus Paceibacter sp.]
MKRIFIAIPIPEDSQKEILDWINSKTELQKLPVRWLAGKNLHLTLVPPWRENDIESTTDKLKDAIKNFQPFEIEFARVRFGSNKNNPRLIWAEGVANTVLTEMKEKLENVFGVKNENRPWLPHLTMARFKPEDFGGFPIKNLDEKISWKVKTDNVVIMESKLSPNGADYEILRRALF